MSAMPNCFTPLAADVVVTGHGYEEVGLLIFPSPLAREMAPESLHERIRVELQALRAEGGGSSHVPTRARVLDEPPNADAGEITDKGYINQAAVLKRRGNEVMALYGDAPDPLTVRL